MRAESSSWSLYPYQVYTSHVGANIVAAYVAMATELPLRVEIPSVRDDS